MTFVIARTQTSDPQTVVDSQKKCLGNSGWSTSFVTSSKVIVKLVEFFTSCGQSERSKSFVTSFKIILKHVE